MKNAKAQWPLHFSIQMYPVLVLWGLLALLWWLLRWRDLRILGGWSLLVLRLLLILLWVLWYLTSELWIVSDHVCVGKGVPEALFIIPGDYEDNIDDEDDSAD